MHSTSMKSLRSRQRFPDDPQALVTLTQQQMVLYQSIQHDMRRFMNHFSLTTNSYHQLMDSLLKCLDLSWESTSILDTNIAEIISSMKQFQEFFNEKVVTPVNEQVEKHKMLHASFQVLYKRATFADLLYAHGYFPDKSNLLEPSAHHIQKETRTLVKFSNLHSVKNRNVHANASTELNRWNKQSKKLNQRLKSLEKAQTKSKTESKLEKAKYRAEDAASTCYEDAASLRPALVQINADGVRACCRTWILMGQGFSKLNETLGDLFIELSSNAKRLERQALTGSLPAWTESNDRSSRLRVSILGNLGSNTDSELSSLHSIPKAINSSVQKSGCEYSTFNDYSSLDNLAQKRFVPRSAQKRFVPRSKSLLIDSYRRQYKPNNRLARASSMAFIRANSVPENAATDESDVDVQINNAGANRIILRSKSLDAPYGLNTIHESLLTESVQLPSPVLNEYNADRNVTTSEVPTIRKSLVTNQSARSTMEEFKPDSSTQRPITITYESQDQRMLNQTAERQNRNDEMNEGKEETTEKRALFDNEEEVRI
ncbi:hypothetical protein FGIG_10693 [Fasciola gigantica]|uniref:BAR domain-containing protein n=1 Tax=Fasciola gigantica TaxID=46835 RepID=A0A504YN25_FASGI|nr:hypothetical protein FGIG_10693 [Fasciola gigantica]